MATRGSGTCGTATLAPASASPAAAGGAATFTVTLAGGPRAWLPSADASWITITAPTSPQEASGTVNYTVAANGAGQPARTGRITVAGKNFVITQAAGA